MTFFRNLRQKDDRSAEPRVPPGYRVYAIGDVHGRLDLLNNLLEQIEADILRRGAAQNVIIFLGDLIDRGPASFEVVERVRTYRPADARLVFLSGNHEEVLLRLLRGESALVQDWLRFGGAECARSYGINAVSLRRMEPDRAVALLRETVPGDHRDFLQTFADTFRIGDYLFVHAGVRPGIALANQSQADLRWIRHPFLESSDSHGFVVVHGHTICADVEVRQNRIGLDTGAYRSGILTALGLEGTERWFLQTRPENGSHAATSGAANGSTRAGQENSDVAAFHEERCSE